MTEPQRPVSPFALALVTTGVLIPGYFVAALTQLLHVGFGLWFTELVVFLGIAWVMTRFGRRSPARYTGLDSPAVRPIAFGFIVGIANFAAAVVPIQYIATTIAPEWLRLRYDQSRLFEAQSGFDLFLIITGVGLAAPLCEEFFFRGVMQKGLTRADGAGRGFSPMAAVVVTGFIFSAFHLDPVGLLARWELGILFGYLALRSGSIWPGIAAHAANNLISSLVFFLAKGQGTQEAEPSWKAIVALAAVGLPVLIGLLLAPSRFKSLLTMTRPWDDAPLPNSRSLVSLAWPWLAAGLLGIGAVLVFDSRGVELNYLDFAKYPLKALPKDASESDRMARDALLPIRAKARKGELPIALYEAKRKELFEEKKQKALGKDVESSGSGFTQNEHSVEVMIPVESEANAEELRGHAQKLGKSLSDEKVGEVDGVEVDGKKVVVHLYGRDADELLNAARRIFADAGVKGGVVRVRRGPQGSAVKEEAL